MQSKMFPFKGNYLLAPLYCTSLERTSSSRKQHFDEQKVENNFDLRLVDQPKHVDISLQAAESSISINKE